MIDQKLVLELFNKSGALLDGHFLLSSGLHSDRYLQAALLLQDPSLAETLGKALAHKFNKGVDAVLSPALGGIVIGHEVARAKQCRALFSEKDEGGKPVLRRGFTIAPEERVLVIEDVITTGLSTKEVAHLVIQARGKLVGIGALVNRSGQDGKALFPWAVPVHSLLTMDVKSWAPAECALCKAGMPVIKPGSRKQ